MHNCLWAPAHTFTKGRKTVSTDCKHVPSGYRRPIVAKRHSRLPGKRLTISFNGSALIVEEDEVRVVVRVALVIAKK